MYSLYNSICLLSTVLVGGQKTAEAAGAAATADPTQTAGAGGMSFFMMIAVYGVVFVALYLLMIRPQRKREKAAKEMQQNIRSGDEVVTSSGFFGKVLDVGEDCFVIEFGTNKGIRVPVRKSDVIGIASPKLTQTTFKAE